jgi:tetratricopeptide (TPR) repeat protein
MIFSTKLEKSGRGDKARRMGLHVLNFTCHALHLRLLAYTILASIVVLGTAQAQANTIASLVEAKKYQEAAQVLQNLAESTKNIEKLGDIFYRLGEIYYTYTHEYLKALEAYDKVVKLSEKGLDDQFLSHIKKGDVYCRLGQHEDAITTYQIVVDRSVPNHFTHQTALQKIRNIQMALEDLHNQQQVISAYVGTPLAVEAQFQIAELYRNLYQLNQPEKAISEYEALLKQYGSTRLSPEAQWRIGKLRNDGLNQPKLAIEAYKKVVDNYPTSNFAADALFRTALIYNEQKQYECAVQVFEQLTRKYPDFWNMHAVYYWLGVGYEKLQNYRRSIQVFRTFLLAYLPKLDPAHFGAIGKYNQKAFNIETELKAKVQQLQSDFPKIEWEKIEKHIAEENYLAALPLVRQLIADAPEGVYLQRAQLELQSIQRHASIQHLRMQIRENPGTPTAAHSLFRIGKIYERGLQDYHQAIISYSQLIDEHPNSPWAAEAMYRSGLIYANHLDDIQNAIEHYKTLIRQYPTSSQTMMANFQLGEIYRSLHQYDKALEAYQTTIAYPEQDQYRADGYKDSFEDRAQFRIGRVHYEDRRYDDAVSAFNEFVASRSHSPRLAAAYVYLAHISEDRGVRDEAYEAYKKARTLIIESPIQEKMVIDEAYDLGFQGTDSKAVIKRLDNLCNRLGGK